MAPADVCHGPGCSLAGLGPVALGYRPCCWPGWSAGSPQCARLMGCWFFPVPRPPYVCRCVRCPGPLGSCSPVCPLGALFCLCGVLAHLAPVHQCARPVCCVGCAVSSAPCVALLVWCPGLLSSCSSGCPLGALLCVCGVLGHLAPVHPCARVVCCITCAVSWATWLLFSGAPTQCYALLLRCPWQLGSSSPVCWLGALCCVCGVLGHVTPVQRCALCCVCGVLGHLGPVHRCARSLCCLVCAVSWATWLLFTGVPAPCVVSRVRCHGPLGSCSPVCSLRVLCCVCAVLGHLAPVHR